MPRTPQKKLLLGLPRFATSGQEAYKPGLDRIADLLDRLDNPQSAFPVIHVAGTNGKGSTASMIAAIATADGVRTGLHTSPHLFDVCERLRVDGVQASTEWLDKAIDDTWEIISEVRASFFEAVLALSLLYFAEKNVNLAVVEVGLGGRLDATNVLTPNVSIITQIDLDHQNILGKSIGAIAREKAGIIKKGVPVLTSSSGVQEQQLFREIAEEVGASFHLLDDEVKITDEKGFRVNIETPIASYSNVSIEPAGTFQQRNGAAAVRALELFRNGAPLATESVQNGLAKVKELAGLRGRLDRIWARPAIFVDVAHNSAAMIQSLETVESLRGKVDRLFLGLMLDKNFSEFAAALRERQIPVSTLVMNTERAFDPNALGMILQELGLVHAGSEFDVFIALDEYVQSSADDSTALLMGSHLVAAEALKWSDQLLG